MRLDRLYKINALQWQHASHWLEILDICLNMSQHFHFHNDRSLFSNTTNSSFPNQTINKRSGFPLPRRHILKSWGIRRKLFFSPKSCWGSPFASKRMNATKARNIRLLCLHTFTMTGTCLPTQQKVRLTICFLLAGSCLSLVSQSLSFKPWLVKGVWPEVEKCDNFYIYTLSLSRWPEIVLQYIKRIGNFCLTGAIRQISQMGSI